MMGLLHITLGTSESTLTNLSLTSGPVACPPRLPDLTPLDYYIWGHMKTLYETKFDSRAALRHRMFAATEHIRNHPDNVVSATQSLLMRAENCIATGSGHFEQLL